MEVITLKEQVCNKDLSKQLEELGVPQESVWCWIKNPKGEILPLPDYRLEQVSTNGRIIKQQEGFDSYSAFTVAELGARLPASIKFEGFNSPHCVFSYKGPSGRFFAVLYCFMENPIIPLITSEGIKLCDLAEKKPKPKEVKEISADTEANARAKMLIHLTRKGVIKNGRS
ncbi:hypothetical protein IID24_03265 [Patescibacteria group bacterium]|nr:hypothetical protein [Patescibacteria group bacterium]